MRGAEGFLTGASPLTCLEGFDSIPAKLRLRCSS